jgi:molybdopterin synthase sulfur carrier subunit
MLKTRPPGGTHAAGLFVVGPLRGEADRIDRQLLEGEVATTLFLPAVLAKLANGKELTSEGATVGEVVADVATRFPALAPRLRDDNGDPYPFVTFYLNDEDIRFQGGFAAAVRDGDELTVVPAIAGG